MSSSRTTNVFRWTTLLTAFATLALARGQDAQNTGQRKSGSLRFQLTIEDKRPAKTKVELQTGGLPGRVLKKMDDVLPGTNEVSLSGIPDGDYFVIFSSPGYAAQWQGLTVKMGKGDPEEAKVQLFRKRYVVLRYAFNTSGRRELSGASIKEGRVAVAHWGSLPYFGQDWQIWQRGSGDAMFGNTPYLDFHRFSDGFGFAKTPEGVTFDDLKEAPTNIEYRCRSTKAEKGLTLFCRVEADRKDGLGYGKIFVEDITETPPPDIERIESPLF